MKAEIISIGDELLLGQTTNTNATYLAKGLTQIGVEVGFVTTIGDDAQALRDSLTTAFTRCEVIITTGGLGPTHDDITKTVAAEYFGSKLVLDQEMLDKLRERFERRGLKMAEVNRTQAEVPDKAQVIANSVGTAPGLIFEQEGKRCIILPGVPSEMKAMCEETIFPLLSGSGHAILFKIIRTTGIPESTLYEKVVDLIEGEKTVKVAFLPKPSGVNIRLTATGENPDHCRRSIQQLAEQFEGRISKYIYGYDDIELEEVVARKLLESGKTIAVAESCTGGLIANKLTNISGSSAYFERGVVTYSNQAKIQLLDVPEAVLLEHGAVSAATAEAMAAGVRRRAGTDFGLATTGIAGPTGGTPEKPVGLVFIGLATPDKTISKRYQFFKDRLSNKERFAQAALELMRREIVKS